jgi:hypothetical protein
LWVTRLVLAASLAALSAFGPGTAAALYVTGTEHVRDVLFTPAYTDGGITHGPFELPLSYLRSFDGTRVKADVKIHFLFDAELEFDELERASYREAVEASVEHIWNNKFVIVDTADHTWFPIEIDLSMTGPAFDHFVAVHPFFGRANALNWFVGDTPSVNAHEFGHMLGLFDEYLGGAVDRYPNPTLSDTGLMGLGALSTTPEMLPRYYDQYLSFVGELNPDRSFRLSRVPQPLTIVLLLSGGVVLLLIRNVRCRDAPTRPTSAS